MIQSDIPDNIVIDTRNVSMTRLTLDETIQYKLNNLTHLKPDWSPTDNDNCQHQTVDKCTVRMLNQNIYDSYRTGLTVLAPEWVRFAPKWDYLRSGKPKCTETYLNKVPELYHLRLSDLIGGQTIDPCYREGSY